MNSGLVWRRQNLVAPCILLAPDVHPALQLVAVHAVQIVLVCVRYSGSVQKTAVESFMPYTAVET